MDTGNSLRWKRRLVGTLSFAIAHGALFADEAVVPVVRGSSVEVEVVSSKVPPPEGDKRQGSSAEAGAADGQPASVVSQPEVPVAPVESANLLQKDAALIGRSVTQPPDTGAASAVDGDGAVAAARERGQARLVLAKKKYKGSSVTSTKKVPPTPTSITQPSYRGQGVR